MLKKGDRVKITNDAYKRGVDFLSMRGTVVGYTKNGFLKVLKDGNKTPSYYHPDFWEKCE